MIIIKAISLLPYWADLVLRGEKTIECRTWKTDYRGELLICSSANPKTNGTICGHALIVCNLADIEPFTKEHLKDSCLREMPVQKSYAWHLDGFKTIIPFAVKGKLNFYQIDDELIHYLDDENMSEKELEEAYKKYFKPKIYYSKRTS